jgi:predicted Zn-dependent protease
VQWCSLCAAGPPTWGRRQFLRILGRAGLAAALWPRSAGAFSVYDEAGDVQIGRENDAQILRQFGYYEAPDLQNYVAQVGQRVVATSDTRFSFQFKVVDHPSINAMALPGGFVYITRGILAEMNDEAQLACILGHEATHVNSRHAAKLMTKALGAQIATILGLGAAAATRSGSAASGIAMISNHVTNYMLLGYGRDYELEADEVGLRYAKRAGYDPRRMLSFMRILRRREIMRGQRVYHAFDVTHPDTAIRLAKADTMADLLAHEGGTMEVRANEYRGQLGGLLYGEAKEQRRLRIYAVKPGDTLASIARQELKDEGRRFELASLNDLKDDAALLPGTLLKLVVSGAATGPEGKELRLSPQ